MGFEGSIWTAETWGGRISLFPHKLVIEQFIGCREVGIEEIRNVRVVQHFFCHLFGRGTLCLELRGKETPFCVRGVKNPHEGWKQIKIARFKQSKLIDK